jgi:hypothetical protein
MFYLLSSIKCMANNWLSSFQISNRFPSLICNPSSVRLNMLCSLASYMIFFLVSLAIMKENKTKLEKKYIMCALQACSWVKTIQACNFKFLPTWSINSNGLWSSLFIVLIGHHFQRLSYVCNSVYMNQPLIWWMCVGPCVLAPIYTHSSQILSLKVLNLGWQVMSRFIWSTQME